MARCLCGEEVAMDVCLQTGSQSSAARLVDYFQQHSDLGVFPSTGFAAQASELGPRSDSQGPCVAFFQGVSLHPAALNTWLINSIFHLHVRRVYWLSPDTPACATLSEVAAAVATSLLSSSPPPARPAVRLQCLPRSLELELGPLLLLSAGSALDLDPRRFSTVVMVVSTPEGYRWGVLPADQLYKTKDNEAPRFKGSVASAVNKLHEALSLVQGEAGAQPWDLNVAIDLGAAPGAWTSYLADHARTVIAVDPALLDPSALRPNVHHLRMRAEQAGPYYHQLMHGGRPPAEAEAAGRPPAGAEAAGEEAGPCTPMPDGCVLADLLVCDMNLHPAETTQVLKSLLPLLRTGGVLVYTLKFAGIARDRSKSLLKLHSEFAEFLEEGRLVWLMANTVNERCYIARRKGPPAGTAG